MKVIILVLNLLTLGIIIALRPDFSLLSSVPFFYVILLAISWIVSKNGEFGKTIKLVLLILPFYLFYSFITYWDIQGLDGFFYSDETYFYPTLSSLASEKSIAAIWQKTIITHSHRDYEGFFLIHGSIAYLAQKYFEGNSIVLQSIWVAFFGVLTNLFIYKLFRFYFYENKAFNLTLIFALFTPFVFYMPWILRDIHIVLLYSIALYFVHKNTSLLNIVILLIISFITIEFRFENGLLLLIFPVLNTFINSDYQQNVKKYFPTILSFSVLIVYYAVTIEEQNVITSIDKIAVYSEFTDESLNDGLGAKLYGLPIGIKQLAIVVNSQFTPMPPWFLLREYKGFIIGSLIMLINTSFWSILILIGLLLTTKKKILKKMPTSLKYVALFGVLVLFVNSPNLTIRRVLCIYPVFYLWVVYMISLLSNTYLKQLRYKSTIIYCGMLIFYVILKNIV